jgi:hypothetical protein
VPVVYDLSLTSHHGHSQRKKPEFAEIYLDCGEASSGRNNREAAAIGADFSGRRL